MLQDARARHDILSHAYSELQAEYLKLKASSSPSPASLGLDPMHQQHTARHHAHHQQLSSSMAAPYGTIPGSTADLGGAFVGAASMGVLHAGNDLDAYLYPDVGSYAL